MRGLTRQRQAALPGKFVRTVGNSAVCMDKVFQSHGGTVGFVVPMHTTGCVHKYENWKDPDQKLSPLFLRP
jgi:hypothetical protein